MLNDAVALKHATNNTAQVSVMVNAAPAIYAFQTVSEFKTQQSAAERPQPSSADTSQLLQWQSDVFARCNEIDSQLNQIRTALATPVSDAACSLRLVGAGSSDYA